MKRVLRSAWGFPAKGLVVLLLAIVLWEGDLSKTDPLPIGYLGVLVVAFVLLFFDRGLPVRFCLGVVIISLAVRESYPFSHFPMYDRFTDHTFYVYVADKDGEPVPLQELTGTRTSRLKKPYDKALDKKRKELGKRKRELTAGECRAAGEKSLASLYQNSPEQARERLEALAPLRLYHVNIFMRDGEIDERDALLIAELELPPR